jgi:hypothetical protein
MRNLLWLQTSELLCNDVMSIKPALDAVQEQAAPSSDTKNMCDFWPAISVYAIRCKLSKRRATGQDESRKSDNPFTGEHLLIITNEKV